mgnify:CR=1 FL=1
MSTTEIQKMPQQTGIVSFNFFDKEQFDTMQRVCKLFAKSELVPDMYKESPTNPLEKAMANCMIAVEIAQRISASPLMIMQNMVPIYGRPSWSSKFLVATVNTCGRFNPLQYKFTNLGRVGKVEYTTYEKKWVNGANGGKGYYKNEAKVEVFDGTNVDNLECIAFTTAKGANDMLESSPISVKLAVQEGWYTKNGSKWPTMTRQMLMYRAASFWTNVYAPELSMGMKTEEEIRDIIDVEYEEVSERVERTKAENANKETINIDNVPATPGVESDQTPAPSKADEPNEGPAKSESTNAPGQEGSLFNETQQDAPPKRPRF